MRPPTRRYARWTADDDETIRTVPPAVAAHQLGRTVAAIHQRRYVLGLPSLKRRWTATEDRDVMSLPPGRCRPPPAADPGRD